MRTGFLALAGPGRLLLHNGHAAGPHWSAHAPKYRLFPDPPGLWKEPVCSHRPLEDSQSELILILFGIIFHAPFPAQHSATLLNPLK